MNQETAKSISSLINNQNNLSSEITADIILEEGHQYLYKFDDNGDIIVCLQLRKNIWYQYEIKYVSTAEKYQHQGYASSLIKEAEKEARKMGCLILQCAIREDNVKSIGLFKKMGFIQVSQFFSPYSKCNFGVWHKVLEPKATRIDTP